MRFIAFVHRGFALMVDNTTIRNLVDQIKCPSAPEQHLWSLAFFWSSHYSWPFCIVLKAWSVLAKSRSTLTKAKYKCNSPPLLFIPRIRYSQINFIWTRMFYLASLAYSSEPNILLENSKGHEDNRNICFWHLIFGGILPLSEHWSPIWLSC